MVYGFVTQSRRAHPATERAGRGNHGADLPAALPGATGPAAVAAQPGPIPARDAGETILVVEDDEDVRRSSVEALRDLGYVVLEAPDAMEAFRLIADRGGIDLLFTDVGLPGGVNGQALADAARNVCPECGYCSPPAIISAPRCRTSGRDAGHALPGQAVHLR